MGKGSYRGGSTVIGPSSGWFTFSPGKKATKLTIQKLAEAAQRSASRAESKRAAQRAKDLHEVEKQEARREKHRAKRSTTGPAQCSKSQKAPVTKMSKVVVERRHAPKSDRS